MNIKDTETQEGY